MDEEKLWDALRKQGVTVECPASSLYGDSDSKHWWLVYVP